MTSLVACAALALFVASAAGAQTAGQPGTAAAPAETSPPGMPGPTPTKIDFTSAVDCYPISHTDSTNVTSVDDLASEYRDGSLWLQLQEDLKAILSTCKFAVPLGEITQDDFASKTFLVVFVSAGRPYYVVVPQQQPYSMTLLGVKSVNAIILGDAKTKSDKVPSDFMLMSTQIQNPLEARIPASGRQAAASFVTNTYAAPIRNATAPTSRRAPDATMYAYAAPGITLPFGRASISAVGTMSVRDPVTGRATDFRISMMYANTPKVHVEFTAVAGAVIGSFHGPQKMKVDASKYASDPLSHSLTMVTVAWHVKPYDSSLSEMSRAERWALLVGAVLTPAAGVGVGVSFGIIRGFAIDGGVIGVWVPSAPAGSSVASVATTDSSQSQLVNRFNAALFIGGNYVLARGR